MTVLEAQVTQVTGIEPIEGADRIETAVVYDFRSIVPKGTFKVGSYVVYIPSDSVLPEWLLKWFGLEGKLRGPGRDTVKPMRLRGVLSEGLIYPVDGTDSDSLGLNVNGVIVPVTLGENVASHLSLTKHEQAVPEKFHGDCVRVDFLPRVYDIENLKKYRNLIEPGTPVRFTEKLHGTQCCVGYIPGLNRDDLFGDFFVFSKGLGSKGLTFKNTTDNVYTRTLLEIKEKLMSNTRSAWVLNNLFIYGEIFGTGVQDLKYGTKGPEFRVFDIKYGDKFLNWDDVQNMCDVFGLDTVPVLFEGPYSRELADEFCTGNTFVNNVEQIREGIVITPLEELVHRRLGRVILKHINPDYLLRKGVVTEFQ